MFEAKVIAFSITEQGKRITTFQLRYPRFILSELNTHRLFSRNSMSSRAIPVRKMIAQVWSTPAAPIHWGANQPGMQANAELTGWRATAVRALWSTAAMLAASVAFAMDKCGAHKQVANRILEPFQWMRTIVTATEWDNFYELRNHPDAQPEFQHLAKLMNLAHNAATPKLLKAGEWHLPYVAEYEKELNAMSDTPDDLRHVSAARCARVSYLTHDGQKPDIAVDLKLFIRLVGSRPLHASPLEHQCTPGTSDTGNLVGWTQYRKLWEKEVT